LGFYAPSDKDVKHYGKTLLEIKIYLLFSFSFVAKDMLLSNMKADNEIIVFLQPPVSCF